MDYKTPMQILESCDINNSFDFIPSDDALIERIMRYGNLDKVLYILHQNGFSRMANCLLVNSATYSNLSQNAIISDVLFQKILKDWSLNKQIYSIDEDFGETLLNTDSVTFTENTFEHLPFKVFYADFSDCEYLRQQLDCSGIFFHVYKTNLKDVEKKSRIAVSFGEEQIFCSAQKDFDTDEVWVISSIRLKDSYYFHDIFTLPNASFSVDLTALAHSFVNPFYEDKDKGRVKREDIRLSEQVYKTFVYQFLLYLSSYKPDIVENEETKRTYKKPNPNFLPKNKFSEIQAYNVGYKMGTAYRTWKKKYKSSDSVPTGRKNRPHAVRAHWRNQWYGSGENKEQRLIWIHEFFTGLKDEDTSTLPAVVHKVSK